MKTKNWAEIKDNVYGVKGTERRDELEREVEGFKIGLLLKKAREEKKLTQSELGELVDKKREYISRIENNGSNSIVIGNDIKNYNHHVVGIGGNVGSTWDQLGENTISLGYNASFNENNDESRNLAPRFVVSLTII
jgi:transcriptional regulator with XRE-family HTH domain